MKKTWLSILALAGLTAADDASDKIQMQQDELDKIKADLEAGKGAIAAREKAEADLLAATNAAAEAKAAQEAAVNANAEKVAALEAEVKRLGGLPGGKPTSLKGGSEEENPKGQSATWMSEATKKAGHNAFADAVLGIV